MKRLMKNKFLIINNLVRFKSTGSSPTSTQSPSQYCVELVRRHDYENYLCSLLLPKNLRPAAFAIRGFNVEIAMIQEQTRELAISDMRYKFWTDALKNIYLDRPPQAPVPLELHRVLKSTKLSKTYFQRILESRWVKWKKPSFRDMLAMEEYAEETVSPIYYLLLEANGIRNVHADHVASHLGKAQGIATLIRSVKYHAQNRILVLPNDLMINCNVSTESVFRMDCSKGLSEVIYQVATRAKQHLDKAEALHNKLKVKTSNIFLPATNVSRYLKKLETYDFNIHFQELHAKEHMLPLHLLIAKMFSKWLQTAGDLSVDLSNELAVLLNSSATWQQNFLINL